MFTQPFIQSADQRKHQSSWSLAFVWGIHRWPVNSPHKGPVTRKVFPFDDVIMGKTTVEVEGHGRVITYLVTHLMWFHYIRNLIIDLFVINIHVHVTFHFSKRDIIFKCQYKMFSNRKSRLRILINPRKLEAQFPRTISDVKNTTKWYFVMSSIVVIALAIIDRIIPNEQRWKNVADPIFSHSICR